MKIKIVKISEHSAHFNQSYHLVGTIGDSVVTEERDDGSTYFELENCQYPPQGENLDNNIGLTVFVDEYEVIE